MFCARKVRSFKFYSCEIYDFVWLQCVILYVPCASLCIRLVENNACCANRASKHENGKKHNCVRTSKSARRIPFQRAHLLHSARTLR